MIEKWREVWRDGFAPVLPTEGLVALAKALREDDERLSQGSTTIPPPLMCVQDFPIECGCPVAYCFAAANGGFADEKATGKQTNPNAATVGATEEFFARACFDADARLGESAACRFFLNWVDDTPRGEMLRELLAEVELALAERAATVAEVSESMASPEMMV